MPAIFKNNAASVLATTIQLNATAAQVANGTGNRFPAPAAGEFFYATIQTGADWEIVKCTARAGDVLTIERAQDGSQARLWGVGASIDMRIPSIVLGSFLQQSAGGDVAVTRGLSVAQNLTVTGLITQAGAPIMPTGAILEYAGSVAPTGWLLCDGAAISRTVYAALFAVLNTAYGEGDGSTTFNLPDRRGKFGVGAGATYPLASTGGGATTSSAGAHTHGGATGPTILTTAQMPSHTHPGTTTAVGDHQHGYTAPTGTLGGGLAGSGGGYNITNNASGGAGSHSHTFTTDSTGGGTGHDHTISSDGAHTHTVTPPYLAANYIIKT
jgi:microcystin-dependent protein